MGKGADVERRPLGRTGLDVTPLGFGTFKIGRNEGIKYPDAYELPTDEGAAQLLNGVIDLGLNLIDTAPAYGSSESRIGAALAQRRDDYVLCSKAGERWGARRLDLRVHTHFDPGLRAREPQAAEDRSP